MRMCPRRRHRQCASGSQCNHDKVFGDRLAPANGNRSARALHGSGVRHERATARRRIRPRRRRRAGRRRRRRRRARRRRGRSGQLVDQQRRRQLRQRERQQQQRRERREQREREFERVGLWRVHSGPGLPSRVRRSGHGRLRMVLRQLHVLHVEHGVPSDGQQLQRRRQFQQRQFQQRQLQQQRRPTRRRNR